MPIRDHVFSQTSPRLLGETYLLFLKAMAQGVATAQHSPPTARSGVWILAVDRPNTRILPWKRRGLARGKNRQQLRRSRPELWLKREPQPTLKEALSQQCLHRSLRSG